jgi:hypothetical protein
MRWSSRTEGGQGGNGGGRGLGGLCGRGGWRGHKTKVASQLGDAATAAARFPAARQPPRFFPTTGAQSSSTKHTHARASSLPRHPTPSSPPAPLPSHQPHPTPPPPCSGRDLVNMAKKRPNVIPIIEDARHPQKYRMLVPMVDVVFADVAQPDQVCARARVCGRGGMHCRLPWGTCTA